MAEGINAPLLFFLEEKTVSLRGKRSPLRRTSSFLFRRKEAKENHLRNSCFSALLPLSPCATQNGRFTYEPSAFPFRAGRVKEHLFSDKSTIPLCLLFLFFKKRKRSPFFSALLLLPPTCYTKRTVHIRTVRFSVPSRTCGKPPFLRKASSPTVSFVSFLQEKKSYPVFLDETKKTGIKSLSLLLPFSGEFAKQSHAKDDHGSHDKDARHALPHNGKRAEKCAEIQRHALSPLIRADSGSGRPQ